MAAVGPLEAWWSKNARMSCLRRGPSDPPRVEQPGWTGLLVGRGQVDDECDKSIRADASGCPAVLVDPDHPYSHQPIRPGRRDWVGDRAHRDRAHGVPGHAQL